jgi:3-oxoacyl-[acyl-carrier-protein] synthase I
MTRVAVTGMGIVSSIGCSAASTVESLRHNRSGMRACQEMEDLGFACHVFAPVREFDAAKRLNKVQQRASLTAQYAMVAAMEAVHDAGLVDSQLEDDRTAVVVGSAFGDLREATRTEQMLQARKSPSRLGGLGAVRMMNSTASGQVATYFHTHGRAYSISSSFAAGVDSIGHAYDLIRFGLQDVAICGGAEEAAWRNAGISFETTGSMSGGFNERPSAACRPYDVDRQGLILSEGAGILILERLESAVRRGARIYAEIVGYGSANDGADMFRSTGQGLRLAMSMALEAAAESGVDKVDYVNAHATGTQVGDPAEAAVLRDLVGDRTWVSSTKGQAGHALGATGAQEAVYSLLMLAHHFVAPTANLERIAPECAGLRHAVVLHEEELRTALTVSIGFGGANACIVFRAPDRVLT